MSGGDIDEVYLRLIKLVCCFDGVMRTAVAAVQDEEEDMTLNLSALCAKAAATMSFAEDASRELLTLGPTSSLMCGIFVTAGVFMIFVVFIFSCRGYLSNVKGRSLSKGAIASP